MIINLERQPKRLRRTLRELNRFRTAAGDSLISITRTFTAIDARDGREVASTADVDPAYVLGDQLYVQPDQRLQNCFGLTEPVSMTRQEIAVARSHIEVWKAIATGEIDHVLILEDDIWFRPGANSAIDRGWFAAKSRSPDIQGPELLYLSYSDADGTAARCDVCPDLFRPERGLWFLSGYILSRRAARKLLLSMPVKGPVDMWMNRRFGELQTLALSSPAILQRRDVISDNSYSVMPYLARAGVIDADAIAPPARVAAGPLFVWAAKDTSESLAMALSMLGLRVRVFDPKDPILDTTKLDSALSDFDALVNPKFENGLLVKLFNNTKFKFLIDQSVKYPIDGCVVARTDIAMYSAYETGYARWTVLCELLNLAQPIALFPSGTPSEWRLFRDDREHNKKSKMSSRWQAPLPDESAWALRPAPGWPTVPSLASSPTAKPDILLNLPHGYEPADFEPLTETFPGNLVHFDSENISIEGEARILNLSASADQNGTRSYCSGALVSTVSHHHGCFEADICAVKGRGLVTGFFLHRANPRQEIDFEITGDDPTSVLLNVYFNPGDQDTSGSYGYRGSPCRIPLGFDASEGFHRYSLDWKPDQITWSVDGRVIHRRGSWDPTPIPHLPMKLHFNLWAPRTHELAGHLETENLPVQSGIRNIQILR